MSIDAGRATHSLRLRGLFLSAALVALGGCAVNPPLQLDALAPANLSALTVDAPFFPQDDYQCGPAALAGVLGAAGRPVTPEELVPQVFIPERRGSLQLELLAATRRAGRIAYLPPSDPGALMAELVSDRPVLVLQNLGTRSVPYWHYAVLTGFDALGNELILNSGRKHGLRMDARRFLRTWDWGGRWAMLALAPGELPAVAEAGRYFEAVAAFEGVAGSGVALAAWMAGAERWPQDARPHLALGNHAYAEGAKAQAVAHYRRGLELEPGDPALVNNLATVLGEIGCPDSARALLTPVLAAIPGQSPWHGILAQTREELAGLLDETGTTDRRGGVCGEP